MHGTALPPRFAAGSQRALAGCYVRAMSVVVLGSANVDVVIDLDRIPGPGETVITERSTRGRGGKGNNQAAAAARAGAPTTLLAAVGADESGDYLLEGMRESRIQTEHVRRITRAPTGTAYVMVDRHAENAIVVVAGANAALADLTAAEQEALQRADVLLMQLEVPMATVLAAARVARAHGAYVMLNAAPYADLPPQLVDAIDLLILNEHEAALTARTDGTAEHLGAVINERVPHVLITLGAAGAVLCRRHEPPLRVAAPRVTAVDTTGAGDTFCGVFAAAKVAGHPERRCLELATSAAALAVQREGAVAAIPTELEIQDAVREFYG